MGSRKKKTFTRLGITLLAALLLLIFKEWPKESETSPMPPRNRPIDMSSLPPDIERKESGRVHPSTSNLDLDERPLPKSNVRDFDDAKTHLRRLFSRGRDFYCSCSYDLTKRPHVDPSSCGLRSKSERAKRIEWEHVVPASFYGRQFAAWKKGDQSCRGRNKRGRECARKVSSAFRQIEGDMYNLVPAVGELNAVRGDNSFGEVQGEPREFGACDFETLANTTEPKADIRGNIARIYFYMDARYPEFGIVHASNQTMLQNWALADPIDAAERDRVRKIELIQGNSFFIGRLAHIGSDRNSGRSSQ